MSAASRRLLMTDVKTDVVLYDVKDGVATLTLNRPERNNAWNGELEVRYFDLLEQAAGDPEARVIVVTGAGKSFCPGADMNVLQGIESGGGGGGRGERRIRLQSFTQTIPKPVICAINGACAGIGLAQTLMMDVRFAAAGAKFTTAFARRGLIAEHGMNWMLPRLIGPAKALDILLSGRVFLAEEALEMGLVNEVFPKDSLLDETYAYARDLAVNCSPKSMATMKAQVYRHLHMAENEAIAEANELMNRSFSYPDFGEGVKSFVEKREPAFEPLPDGYEPVPADWPSVNPHP
jgi:enoyl-CoA hydratase/carnithine racemase